MNLGDFSRLVVEHENFRTAIYRVPQRLDYPLKILVSATRVPNGAATKNLIAYP